MYRWKLIKFPCAVSGRKGKRAFVVSAATPTVVRNIKLNARRAGQIALYRRLAELIDDSHCTS